jgi:hypothetical protein
MAVPSFRAFSSALARVCALSCHTRELFLHSCRACGMSSHKTDRLIHWSCRWGQYLECTSSRAAPEQALLRAPWTPPGGGKLHFDGSSASSSASSLSPSRPSRRPPQSKLIGHRVMTLTPPHSGPDRERRHRKRVATTSPPPPPPPPHLPPHNAMIALQQATGNAASDSPLEVSEPTRRICQVRSRAQRCFCFFFTLQAHTNSTSTHDAQRHVTHAVVAKPLQSKALPLLV